MAGIADACILPPCSEQRLDPFCFSPPPAKDQFFNWKKQQSPDQRTVLIDARAAAPAPNSLEVTATIKHRGGKKKQESESLRQCPHQRAQMCSQTRDHRHQPEKSTKSTLYEITFKAPFQQEIASFQGSEVPSLLQPAVVQAC